MKWRAGWLAACTGLAWIQAAAAGQYVDIAGGRFRSAMSVDGAAVTVAAYKLRAEPVTNAEFLGFVLSHPQWRRDRAPALFAAAGYLAAWRTASDYGKLLARAPVTQVSWYAARAYCASEGARLPTWHEWERAAAADDKRADARDDPAWREQILRWYEQPGGRGLPSVGRDVNFWGVADLHGSIYEWVEDFNGLFVSTDSRAQGEQRTLATCGAAALSLGDRENYAILMRIAMLVALNGNDAPQVMGFRCAKDSEERAP
ncbi:formylglycine-generating enzyme family protein [Chromobacterium paludis]|uniref:Formylglycine-generating enzyme family protein n=1 Tax=Chromobacterium paludis TaxID=2605945 RepID=A0A5C1DH03_9NEIS|nr:formylglycine-generating enzyme family protein [Chromobacterium paludis]QEL55257.1 formylglycine-generating enzyme family protein [Chromobacterium paludis]